MVTSYLAGSLLQRVPASAGGGSTMPPGGRAVADGARGARARSTASPGCPAPARSRPGQPRSPSFFGRATIDEQRWLRGLVTGEVRQGALDALVQEALAAAAGVPLPAVRRAAMLAGSTVAIASAAFEGEEALAAIGLEVGRPVLPMLASSAPDLEAAMAKAGRRARSSVDTKLDGIRIQVHRSGDDVVIATRSLDDITHRLPEVVALAGSLPGHRPGARRRGAGPRRRRPAAAVPGDRVAHRHGEGVAVTAYFFDLLHLDGRDLLDAPGDERPPPSPRWCPGGTGAARRHRRPRRGAAVHRHALAAGHEGVVVKSLSAPYAAGRRGSGWVKVKPVHTLDLVVLAVEWGSGRRKGWLSNIHLGARDPDAGGFVMLGKTFKGMTDEMLAWQTERFTELARPRRRSATIRREVRPEQVVEIAFDGIQRSTRYPGGIALRFARVVRYRDDKTAGRGRHHRRREGDVRGLTTSKECGRHYWHPDDPS